MTHVSIVPIFGGFIQAKTENWLDHLSWPFFELNQTKLKTFENQLGQVNFFDLMHPWTISSWSWKAILGPPIHRCIDYIVPNLINFGLLVLDHGVGEPWIFLGLEGRRTNLLIRLLARLMLLENMWFGWALVFISGWLCLSIFIALWIGDCAESLNLRKKKNKQTNLDSLMFIRVYFMS